MRKAIVYATLSGTVLKCAEIMSDMLGDVELINIKKDRINIDDYDVIIIGGAYYAGLLNSKLKKFIKINKDKLFAKVYAIYVCCGTQQDYKKILIKNIGKEIVENAYIVECFGYKLNTNNVKGITKVVYKIIAKSYENGDKPKPQIYEERIEAFCNKIKKLREE